MTYGSVRGSSVRCPSPTARSGGGRKLQSERGSAAVELALLVPALVIVLGLMIGGGRLWFARTTVTEAAQSSARAASLSRSPAQAAATGRAAGQESLRTGGLECRDQTVSVDVAGFGLPVGQPATVTSTTTCVIAFADLLLPGMPGTISLTAAGASALDTYRSRR
jgi:Flp pilus assembly protein TadG